MKRLLEEAGRMVRISSIATDGNEEIANFASSLLAERGLKVQLQQVMHSLENVSKRQFNVIGILGEPLVDRKTRKGLLLGAHLDTVSPGRLSDWTQTDGNPFSSQIRDGKIYGLGVADAKLDFLCKLHAVEKFKEKKLKMPIYLVGSAGEELGMIGAKYLIKSLALNPRYVLIGAPTELKVAYAHKSQNIFKISIRFNPVERDARGFNRRIRILSNGRSAHGANPSHGKNAILQLIQFLGHAHERGFEMRFTHLDGGEAVNKVPDNAYSEFYLSSHQFEDFKIFFNQIAESSGDDASFKMELGGPGETGVKFLPEGVYPCLLEVWNFFTRLSSQFEQENDLSYSPSSSTINMGLLKQNPWGLEISFDLRLLPEVSIQDNEKKISEGIQSIASRYLNLNLSVTKDRLNPGLRMTLEHELVRICQQTMENAGLQGGFQKKSISTEAALFFQAGYEAVAFGPGVSYGNIHGPNENVFLDHLEKSVIFYEKLIEKICI